MSRSNSKDSLPRSSSSSKEHLRSPSKDQNLHRENIVTLRVFVDQAKNLIAADVTGTSDPYVSIKLFDGVSTQSKKTKVIYKTLNPVWTETIEFAVSTELANSSDLLLRLWDKDLVGKDFLGEVRIPVSNITQSFNEASQVWYKLTEKGGEVGHRELGSISLKIGFDNADSWSNIVRRSAALSLEAAADEDSVSNLSVDEMKLIEGVLTITVKEAINLPDEKQPGIFDCDPFTVVSFSTNTFRTRVIRHNTHPVWNEKAVFLVKKTEEAFQIKFSVYDFDRFSANDFIACTSIPVMTFIEKKHIDHIEFDLDLDSKHKHPKNGQPKLVLGSTFQTFEDLKRQFWARLGKNFDSNGNSTLDKFEFISMLDTLATTVTPERVDEVFATFGGKAELSFDEVSDAVDKLIGANHASEQVFSLGTCPFTGKPLPENDAEALLHLAINASANLEKVDQFVMSGFVTEAFAKKGWFNRIVNYVARGEYNIGADNANILVQDRHSGEIQEEKMPGYIRMGIRALYQSRLSHGMGSASIKHLLQSLSVKQGIKYDSPDSVKSIKPFIEFHKLSVDEILDPLDSFKNFNEFFYRKLKPEARPVGSPDPNVLLSPADARIMLFQDLKDCRIWIKGTNFTVGNLFKDPDLGTIYDGGSLAIFRLAPQDYHRYHSPVNGVLGKPKEIPGTLYTVNPMAVREEVDVYTENKRIIWSIDSPEFGKVTLAIIGAMMVGSIILTAKEGQKIQRHDELGYFAFGGSTVVALFEKNAVVFDDDLQLNSKKQLETLVKVGDAIGKRGTRGH